MYLNNTKNLNFSVNYLQLRMNHYLLLWKKKILV